MIFTLHLFSWLTLGLGNFSRSRLTSQEDASLGRLFFRRHQDCFTKSYNVKAIACARPCQCKKGCLCGCYSTFTGAVDIINVSASTRGIATEVVEACGFILIIGRARYYYCKQGRWRGHYFACMCTVGIINVFVSMHGFLDVPVYAGGIAIAVAEACGFVLFNACIQSHHCNCKLVHAGGIDTGVPSRLQSSIPTNPQPRSKISTGAGYIQQVLPVSTLGYYAIRSTKLLSLARDYE